MSINSNAKWKLLSLFVVVGTACAQNAASLSLVNPGPSNVSPGGTITATLNATNIGSSTWTPTSSQESGKYVVSVAVLSMINGGPSSSPVGFANFVLPQAVYPGQSTQVPISLAAPSTPGNYVMYACINQVNYQTFCGSTQLITQQDGYNLCPRFSFTVITLTTVLRSGVLSHIAAGASWATEITLVNTSSSPVSVTVTFRNDDGNPLNLPVTTEQQGLAQTTTTSTVNVVMSANTTLVITTGQLAEAVVGWAEVSSSGPVSGFGIFRTSSPNSPVSEGTVPLQVQSPSSVVLPYDNTTGFVMGASLVNLSTAFTNVSVMIWDDKGNLLGTQHLSLVGNGHTAFVLPTQFPLTAGRRGIVKFQSSGGLGCLGLRFSPYATFTSVPTIY